MTIYQKWIDFVLSFERSESMRSHKDRLRTADWPNILSTNAPKTENVVVTQDYFSQFGDAFEAMEIHEQGDVVVWGKTSIMFLYRKVGPANRFEKISPDSKGAKIPFERLPLASDFAPDPAIRPVSRHFSVSRAVPTRSNLRRKNESATYHFQSPGEIRRRRSSRPRTEGPGAASQASFAARAASSA